MKKQVYDYATSQLVEIDPTSVIRLDAHGETAHGLPLPTLSVIRKLGRPLVVAGERRNISYEATARRFAKFLGITLDKYNREDQTVKVLQRP